MVPLAVFGSKAAFIDADNISCSGSLIRRYDRLVPESDARRTGCGKAPS